MLSNIRNFAILAHINHGKSTLADRFLELTATVPQEKMRPQYLDQLSLERERGITIKMAPVRMLYHPEMLNAKRQNSLEIRNWELEIPSSSYVLNLVDTPGHIDFSYEVSRALKAVEGAILLVDALKGVQAQTVANYNLAKKQGLKIIPVINKIDLKDANIGQVKGQVVNLTNLPEQEILEISAKFGTNVKSLLFEIIRKIPPPKTDTSSAFQALIFDSAYDAFSGVIAYVRVFGGQIKKGQKVNFLGQSVKTEIKDLGIFRPELQPKKSLAAGEIGWVATGLKEIEKVRVGDTITESQTLKLKPLQGFKVPQPKVFASFYPSEQSDFLKLRQALHTLKLNDASVCFQEEISVSLGRGFRLGFLGRLHWEIIKERLKRELATEVIVTAPSVAYLLKIPGQEKWQEITSAEYFPSNTKKAQIKEPWIRLIIITPRTFLSPVLKLLQKSEAQILKIQSLDEENLEILSDMPLAQIMSGFYDKLKKISSGFASMDYELTGFREAKVAKLEFLVAGEPVEAFSEIVPQKKAFAQARKKVKLLKKILPQQVFAVSIQARFQGKIIARADIPALKKAVTASLYGGDFSRKKKLLTKQRKGQKKLKILGRVKIPKQVFGQVAQASLR